MTEKFKLGATIRVEVDITLISGEVVDPATTVISIADPVGTLVTDDVAMDSSISGTYYYDYALPAEPNGSLGIYSVRIVATSAAGRVSIERVEFEAVKSI